MYTFAVKAVDGDRGINNEISYSLLQGTLEAFVIDSKTGILYSKKKLDRESPSNSNGAYILKVIVSMLHGLNSLLYSDKTMFCNYCTFIYIN